VIVAWIAQQDEIAGKDLPQVGLGIAGENALRLYGIG